MYEEVLKDATSINSKLTQKLCTNQGSDKVIIALIEHTLLR